jgi:antitoxin ChpS
MSYEGRLRKVGGSVMLAIPPVMLEALGLSADAPVDMAVEAGRLVVERKTRRRYSLDELLAQGAPSRRGKAKKDPDWVSGPRAGRELL